LYISGWLSFSLFFALFATFYLSVVMAPWSLIAISAAIAVVSIKPEYSVQQSYIWTATVFLGTTLLAKFIYSAILYPQFLTPLRHLPTPPVWPQVKNYFLKKSSY
jgi:hypothetical protein